MANFFFDYGLFALKTLTVFVLLGAVVAFVIALVSRAPGVVSPDRLEVVKLNEKLEREQEALRGALMDDATWQQASKEKKAQEKAKLKLRKKELKSAGKKRGSPENLDAEKSQTKKRVFVLDFDGDIQASAVANLRREISAILSMATSEDEVVVRLESGGGLVHSYGLGASQLARIKAKQIPLTICVDKVAASGGYMMACVADQLLAAPFSVIGSIGVVAQLPNFNRLLKKHDVDIELLTAGEHKRTLTILGENTEQGRKKFRDDLDETHLLFKDFVKENRPQLEMKDVATGEIWYGTRALQKGLVDKLQTSDEYIIDRCESADVLSLRYTEKKTLQERLMSQVSIGLERGLIRLWSRLSSHVVP